MKNWGRVLDYRFRISDFGFRIGGIAALYPFIKQIEYLNSAIRNLKSEIYYEFEAVENVLSDNKHFNWLFRN
jgi:hypothetical protein